MISGPSNQWTSELMDQWPVSAFPHQMGEERMYGAAAERQQIPSGVVFDYICRDSGIVAAERQVRGYLRLSVRANI